MSVFAARRHNMVESQLRTNKVTDERVLSAFESVPREAFIGSEMKGLAYIDEDLSIGHGGRFLLEPMVLARLLQALELTGTETVLDIAAGCGYGTALLARLAQSVLGIEQEAGLAVIGQQHLIDQSADNAVILQHEHSAGFESEAPYDAIMIEGAVASVPEVILEQLTPDGRLVVVERKHDDAPGKAMLYRRSGDGFASHRLFDAQTPILPEFRQQDAFSF